ncbi:MAG: amidase [Myxococcota bacterium]
MTELAFRTAHEIARAIARGEVSALEATDAFIGRIERYDGEINAVVVRDFDRAREAAKRADAARAAGEDLGPLHGVPMTIKESYDIEGLPTTWGFEIFKDHVASSDALSVARYKAAGAIFLGKTNVPVGLADLQSFNPIYGRTGNPWDTGRTPGGSSGGSAAALAAGLTGLESGSDIGGSIRNPAHFCGVYGHKPTWMIVPPQGHALPGQLASPDIAVCGPLARSAEDLRLALDTISGPEPLQSEGWTLTLPKPRHARLSDFRVAIWANDEIAPVDREVEARVHGMAEVLRKAGATVSETARPDIHWPTAHATYISLLNAIMGAAISDEERKQFEAEAARYEKGDLSPRAVNARSMSLTHAQWLGANNHRESLRYAWRDFFQEWDIVLCPQTATPAFPHDPTDLAGRTLEVSGVSRPFFEQLFWAGFVIASYLPSTVFPTGPSEAGLPIGLQAVGGEYQDYTTIEFARLMAEEIGGFVAPAGYAD